MTHGACIGHYEVYPSAQTLHIGPVLVLFRLLFVVLGPILEWMTSVN